MKIAMMVRGYITSPRPSDIVYAPIDLAVAIAEGLVKRGHQVDFYGPKGTRLKTGVKTLNLRPLAHNQIEFQQLIIRPDLLSHYIPALWDSYLVHDMFRLANEGRYDLLHFMHPEVALSFTKFYPKVPVVYTLHDPIQSLYKEIFKMYKSKNQHFISISNNQRRTAPRLPYIARVYNGIDLSRFPLSEKPGQYLLFVGRVVSEKGIKEAVEVARKSGEKLVLIGPIYSTRKKYFDKYVKPYLGDKIRYLGYVRQDELYKYYQKAKALLVPIKWEEPFGLTMIEAMACGTPVIAFNRGSVPEIIVNDRTGYIVSNTRGMIAAISKIDKVSRRACYQHVKQNFTIDHMVDGYEAAFTDVLKKRK